MKLTVIVYDNYPDEQRQESILPNVECIISGSGEDVADIAIGGEEVRDDFSQTEQVARLTMVAGAIRKAIADYYGQDTKSLPKVVIENNSDNERN